MGWAPADLRRPEVLVLSTLGGIRNPDGTPLALGYHTGHWEVGLLVQAAAEEIRALGGIPFAAFCTDPCDGRTQGTTGMMDSLAYRNDAAIVLRRLIRSLPTRRAIMGVGTCDKGLPAMTMALAACRDLPAVIVPGGVTLPASDGEDAGKAQTVGARFAHGRITLAAGGGHRLPGLRLSRRRLPVPRNRRHRAGGRGGARPGPSPHRARALRTADLARRGAALRARRAAASGPGPDRARRGHGGRGAQRDGRVRGLRRLHELPAAPARHRPCRGPEGADARGVEGRELARAAHRGRAARTDPIRPCASSWPAACPRSCCTCATEGSSTSPPSPPPARRWARRSTGGRAPSAAGACAIASARRTASIPTT